MTFYIRCSKCHYQEKKEGNSIGAFKCPRCEGRTFDMKSGTPPSWWIDEPQYVESEAQPAPVERRVKVQFSPVDPLFIAGAIYSGFVGNPWWFMVVPLIVGNWFFNPRWNRDEGWRFTHE
jgi:hypothetical protein